MKQVSETRAKVYALLAQLELNKIIFTEAKGVSVLPHDVINVLGDTSLRDLGIAISQIIDTFPKTDKGYKDLDQLKAEAEGRTVVNTQLEQAQLKAEFIQAVTNLRFEENRAKVNAKLAREKAKQRLADIERDNAAMKAIEMQKTSSEELKARIAANEKEMSELKRLLEEQA